MKQHAATTTLVNALSNTKSFQRKLFGTTAMTMAGLLASVGAAQSAPPTATELPTGFDLQVGSVDTPTVTTTGFGINQHATMDITQNSKRAVVNWNTFNIGERGHVNVDQTQGTSSILVNRVTGSVDKTYIYGSLTANGQLVILDKNGVFIRKNATIDAASVLISTGSTGDLFDSRFGNLANESFQLNDTDAVGGAEIVNRGTISVADAGLVALVAPTVKNQGVINAKLGRVQLDAGKSYIVDFMGDGLISLAVSEELENAFVENARNPSFPAEGGVINAEGGVVTMTAHVAGDVLDTVVNMKGVINANSFQAKDGKIVLNGTGGKVEVSGTMTASRNAAHAGSDGAGEITVEGRDVKITDTASLKASNTAGGNGGVVRVWGRDYVHYAGFINISGANNGGSAEISSDGDSENGNVHYSGTVNALGGTGTTGTLTIDPAVVVLGDGSSFEPVVDIAALAETLGLSNVHIIAGDKIILAEDADLSHYTVGVTTGNLALDAPTLDLLHDLTIGSGDLSFLNTDTINLGGLLKRDTGTPTLLGQADLSSPASLVNILGDSAKIQQGIHLAAEGGTVHVAIGAYGENIDIYKSLTVEGEEGGVSVPLIYGTNHLGDIIVVTADNVTVKGFEINGHYIQPGPLSWRGLVASGVSNLNVTGNTFSDFFGAGVRVTGLTDSSVSGNTFSDSLFGINATGGTGLTFSGNTVNGTSTAIALASATDALISGNIISDTTGDSISVTDTANINLFGNIVTNAGGKGIFIDPSSGFAIGNVVTGAGGNGIEVLDSDGFGVFGNFVSGSGGDGIFVKNSDGASIGGNVVTGSGDDGIDVEQSDNANIAFNHVNGAGHSGIEIDGGTGHDVKFNAVKNTTGDGIAANGVSETTITGNFIANAGGDGIDIDEGNGVDIEFNHIGLTGDNGIEVIDTADAVVFANFVKDAGNNGIYIDPTTGSAIGNVVIDAGGHGIAVFDSPDFEIIGNYVTRAGKDGIFVKNSANVIIALNFVSDSDQDNIDVEHSSGATITENTSTFAGDAGIEVDGGESATITQNTVEDAAGHGIATYGTDTLLIRKNTIKRSGDDGIHVERAKDAWVRQNKISRSGGDGIDVTGYKAPFGFFGSYPDNLIRVQGNTVTRSAGNGVEITDGKNVTAHNNKINHSGSNGIDIEDSKHVTVTRNTVRRSGDDGIGVENASTAYLENNKVERSGEDGIDLTDVGDAELVGNTIFKSGENGIEAFGVGTLDIAGNTVDESAEDGINVRESEDVTIAGNTITDSGLDGIDVRGATGHSFFFGEYLKSTVNIIANAIFGSEDSGIEVADAKQANVKYNTVGFSGDNGIDIEDGKAASVKGNLVFFSGGNGVDIDGTETAFIGFNTVKHSGKDGVHVAGSEDVTIAGNTIKDSGFDGVDVTGKTGHGFFGEYLKSTVNVIGNFIFGSGDNGVEIADAKVANVKYNKIGFTGNNGVDVEDSKYVTVKKNTIFGTGRDGVNISNADKAFVGFNTVTFAGGDGVEITDSGEITVLHNVIKHIRDNGIEISDVDAAAILGNFIHGGFGSGIAVDSTPFAYISGNHVSSFYNGIDVSGGYRVDILRNTLLNLRNDGIQADHVAGLDITGNFIRGYGDDGVQVSYSGFGYGFGNGVNIAHNIINGLGREGTTGIRLGDNEESHGKPTLRIATVEFPGYGADMSGNGKVRIAGNIVKNNDVGLDARAFNNGYIGISGNLFWNNGVGAWIGSGLIDLTRHTNVFVGGDTALRFERSSYYPEPEYNYFQQEGGGDYYEETGPVYSFLKLKGDTLGTTVFSGQSTYFVELLNGAFFAPGSPTIIDGTQATWNGVHGGLMSAAQLNAIESMIHDYDDDETLGQIFPGFTPAFNFDDNQILKKIFGNTFRNGRAGVFIFGLPNTGPGGPGFGFGNLPNISPAAGGNDDPDALDNLEPGAGGDDVVEGCWTNLGGGGGKVFSIDLSDDSSEILKDQSSCQSGGESL